MDRKRHSRRGYGNSLVVGGFGWWGLKWVRLGVKNICSTQRPSALLKIRFDVGHAQSSRLMRYGSSNVKYLTGELDGMHRATGTEDLQIFEHLGVPKALSNINVGNGIGLSDIPDPGISSSGSLQVLLETPRSICGTGLVLLITGYSPGIKVGFENFGSEVVISILRIVSSFLKTVSVASHRASQALITW